MGNNALKIVIVLVILCYCLVGNSYKEGTETIVEKMQDKDTIFVIAESDSLFIKGKNYYSNNEYTSAIDFFLKSDSVINAYFGTDSPYYGYGKRWTSSCYHKLGMDSIALDYSFYYDKEPIDKMLTHSSDSVIWIALKLEESGQIHKALEKLLEAARLEEQELGPNNYWMVNTLCYCAGLYSEIGQFEKAIELGTYAVEFYKVNFGSEHPNYATCLSTLASIYSDAGQFEKAIELGTNAVKSYEAFFGTEHPNYATSLSNLSTYYNDFGNAFVAIELEEEALGIEKKLNGTEKLAYANKLSNLAESYSSIGNYPEALHLGEKAMDIRRKVLGTEHSDYAISLICLADYNSAIGNYSKALILGTEAMKIWKKVFGTNHPYYATSLSRLSGYYSDLGDYAKAVQLTTEALEIRKRILGTQNPHYATSLGNLALLYSYLGNYTETIRIEKEELELSKKIFGTEHPHYATSLVCLANAYANVGNYAEAQQLGNMALKIWENAYGTEHPGYANILNCLAMYNAELDNYTMAILLGIQSNKIVKKNFGSGHPDFALSLSNLALFYANVGNFAESYSYLKQHIISSQPYLLNSFMELSKNLRESLWTRKFASNYIYLLPNVVEKDKNKESISELYDKTCLFAKGILLNTDMEIRNLVFESGDSSLINRYNALSSNISIYNKLIETPINNRYINADSLDSVIQQQEMELAQKSKAYGDYVHNLTINWRDVQNKLGDDDIAVEFLDFPVLNTNSSMYVALTLKKDYDSPHMITLFEKSRLNAIPQKVYYTQTDVADLVWKPLEDELKGVKNIFFSPSGELHRIGIEYLPVSETESICDVYTLHRLSSTRQLAVIQDKTKGKTSILYGGINYDDKSGTIPVDSTVASETIYRAAFTYRSNVDSLTLRNSYDYLEGTKKEVDLIADDMKAHSVPYIYYSGTDATEESFKKLDGTKPKMIHIATHGFYLTEEEADNTKFACSELELLTDVGKKAGRQIEHKPMTRSGLLLSGCNHTIRHEQIPDGEEDGILTAQEISTLDLRGLELVVLSACQTGLGDIITGEGVFGLQRGFKKAGAKTIIMSLWNVNDESTMKIMTSFYHYYLEGMSKEEAFRTALYELRKDNSTQQERPDWASFIMLDGLD